VAPVSIVLVVLLVAWAILLFGGYFRGQAAGPGERRMARWTRLSSSLVLALAAWLFVLITQATPLAPYTLLIAVGMTLGLAGDLLLARVVPVSQHFLAGIAAFAAGHVAYILAGLRLAGILGLTAPLPRLLGWLAWLAVGAFGWYYVVHRGQKESNALDWVALVYALLLASTAGVATGLALQDARLVPLALGAALFLFSDLMIAAKEFAGKSFGRIQIDDLIWLTYGPGQCFIVYTTAFLLA
jgi:uncharacterized membrane protein YhhN